MVFEFAYHCFEQEACGGKRFAVVEHIAIGAINNLAAANYLAHIGRRRGMIFIEQPFWRPIRATHVPCKECDIKLELTFGSNITNFSEIGKSLLRNRV